MIKAEDPPKIQSEADILAKREEQIRDLRLRIIKIQEEAKLRDQVMEMNLARINLELRVLENERARLLKQANRTPPIPPIELVVTAYQTSEFVLAEYTARVLIKH